MANIIDAFLVTLGLDSSGMKKGAEDAAKAQEKIEQDANKSAKGVSNAERKRDNESASTRKRRAAEESAALKKQQAEQVKAAKEREAQAKKAAEALAKVRNEILAIGAALFGLSAIKGMGSELISTDTNLKRMSETLDVSVSKLSAWQDAGTKFGATADDVADAFRKANVMQMEFNRGNIEPVKDIMMQAGMENIPFDTKILDKATSAEDRLKGLADVAQKMTAKGAQYAFSKAGFSDADIRMLRAGGTELDALVKHFQALNPDIESASKGSEELAGKWAEVRAQAKGIGNSILDVLLPALKWGLDALTKMMTYAKDHIPETTAVVIALGTAFLMLSGKAMVGTVSMMASVISGLGGTEAAAGTATVAVSGFAGKLVTMLAGLGKLTIAFSVGYALGSAIYDGLISGTKVDDFIGETMHKVMAAFGNKESQQALKANGKSVDTLDKVSMLMAAVTGAGGIGAALGNAIGSAIVDSRKDKAQTSKRSLANGSSKLNGPGASSGAAGDIDQLMALGWTRDQAAGIAANIQRESGGNPRAVGDNGQAYGLGQWHPDRQANFAKFAGKDIRQSSRAEQVAFIDHELRRGTEQAAGKELGKSIGAAAAGAIVSKSYERPRDVNGEAAIRANMAQMLARPAIDKALAIGAQAAVVNSQTSNVNNASNSNSQVETHIGTVHINAPQAKTNGDVASALSDKLKNYAFASQSNLGLA